MKDYLQPFVLMLDNSTSTTPYLPKIVESVNEFIEKLKDSRFGDLFYNHEIIISVIAFNGNVERIVNMSKLENVEKIRNIESNGVTDIGKAVDQGLEDAITIYNNNRKNYIVKKPIVVTFTDGKIDAGYNASHEKQNEFKTRFKNSKSKLNNWESQNMINFASILYGDGINSDMLNLSISGKDHCILCNDNEQSLYDLFNNGLFTLVSSTTSTGDFGSALELTKNRFREYAED